jgi:hypothetical protein
VGIAFIIVGTISAIFNLLALFGIYIDFIGLRWWGFWLFIPAFFIMIGGFEQIYTNKRFKKDVASAILNREGKGTYKLEDIALEVGIRPSDLLKVLADLRINGVIDYRFNSSTGEIILGESVTYVQAEEFEEPTKKIEEPLPSKGKSYCVYCGHKLSGVGEFCENCGSKI